MRFAVEHVHDREVVPVATSKSLKSCAGVIFTAPVPFFGIGVKSSEPMIGIRPPTGGRIANLPMRCFSRFVLRDAQRSRYPRAWSRVASSQTVMGGLGIGGVESCCPQAGSAKYVGGARRARDRAPSQAPCASNGFGLPSLSCPTPSGPCSSGDRGARAQAKLPFTSRCSTSRSEIAVSSFGVPVHEAFCLVEQAFLREASTKNAITACCI